MATSVNIPVHAQTWVEMLRFTFEDVSLDVTDNCLQVSLMGTDGEEFGYVTFEARLAKDDETVELHRIDGCAKG